MHDLQDRKKESILHVNRHNISKCVYFLIINNFNNLLPFNAHLFYVFNIMYSEYSNF